MSAPPSRLRRPGLLAVLLGVLARVLWFALGVPMPELLGRVPLFAKCSTSERRKLAALAEEVPVS